MSRFNPNPNGSRKKAGTQRSMRRWESSKTGGSGRRRCHRLFRMWSPIPHPESSIHRGWLRDGPRTSIPGPVRSPLKSGRRSKRSAFAVTFGLGVRCAQGSSPLSRHHHTLPDPRTGELQRGGWYSWLFWGIVAIFYLYEFFVRVTPNVILPQLGRDLDADAASLGSAMAFYLWIYAPSQLIVGWLFDRFGTKYLVSTAAIICGVGCVVFALVWRRWRRRRWRRRRWRWRRWRR